MRHWQHLLTRFVGVFLLCAAPTTIQAASDGIEGLVPGSPAASLYGSNHLAGLPDKAKLVFDYRFEGTRMEKPFVDDVFLDFTRRDGEEKAFDVEITVFPQTRSQIVGPLSAASINPILLIFFQRDVTHMSNGTGGNQHYFRNAIRRALRTPDENSVSATTIDFNGEQVAAHEISFQPFIGDSNQGRLRGFAGKTYHFIVSDAVPGGIYEAQSETPDENGGDVLLRETYRFREIQP